jgi:hypothetical protein
VREKELCPPPGSSSIIPDATTQEHDRTKHELGALPVDLKEFDVLFKARSERLRTKLNGMRAGTLMPSESGLKTP